MNRFINSILIATTVIVGTTSAQAAMLSQPSTNDGKWALWQKVGAWEVYGNSATGACYFGASYFKDTYLGLMGRANGTMALYVADPQWAYTDGQTVAMAVEFDESWGAVTGTGYGEGSLVTEVTDLFVERFKHANWLRLGVNGNLLGTFNLPGTYEATAALVDCVKAMSGVDVGSADIPYVTPYAAPQQPAYKAPAPQPKYEEQHEPTVRTMSCWGQSGNYSVSWEGAGILVRDRWLVVQDYHHEVAPENRTDA